MTILKDIALELEYVSDKDKEFLFRKQTRCISALYGRTLVKYKTQECWKVLIRCVEETGESKISTVGGVCEVRVDFNMKNFFSANEYEKKKYALEVLKKGIDIVVKEKQWDKSVFDDAYNKVIELDYVNNWVWKKSLKSPTKEYIAEVFCEHNVESFDISLIIKLPNGNEVKRVKIISETPHEFVYSNHLGQLKWLSPEEVALINVFGTKQCSVKL